SPEQALVIAKWPSLQPVNEDLGEGFDFASDVIAGIRTIRKVKNIPMKDALQLAVLNDGGNAVDWDVVIAKLTNLSAIDYVNSAVDGALTFRVKSNEYFVPMAGAIDIDAEINKLEDELEYIKGFL